MKNALSMGWGHFKTITHHKWLVMKHCFKVGLYKQGLLHDMSKYSWTEFSTGVRFFTGTHSPSAEARKQTGISRAWLHHKGRNKHHFEYWIDLDLKDHTKMVGFRMPYKYVAEMFCDRVAASKIYLKDQYTEHHPWDYYQHMKDSPYMHPTTHQELEFLLKKLRDEGEDATFAWLKAELKRRKKAKDYYD